MASGLAIDGVDDQVETQWTPVERVSMAERFDALSKAGSDVPWRTKMTDILGFPSDQVDRMQLERSADAALIETGTSTRQLSVAEVVQKVYLGVGKVISQKEARRLLVAAGADIDPDEAVPAPTI